MNKTTKGLNGSADLLADAFRKTIGETLDPVVELLTEMESNNKARHAEQKKDFISLKNQVSHQQKALDGNQKEARK